VLPAPDRSALRGARHTVTRWSAVGVLVLLAGCSGGAAPKAAPPVDDLVATASPAGEPLPSPDAAVATAAAAAAGAAGAAAGTLGRPPVDTPVREVGPLRRPDVLVSSPTSFPPDVLERLTALSPDGGTVAFRKGTLKLGDADVPAVAIDPSAFRSFAGTGTAEATAVWQTIARGEAVASHEVAKRLAVQLGGEVQVAPVEGAARTLRLGALATTGVPSTDLLLDDRLGETFGLPAGNAVLLSAGKDQAPEALADEVRKITGDAAAVDLLTAPAGNPVAFLTGSKAAKAFGNFSYRYFPDGTIQPDEAWVKANIVTTNVPIMGRVTCHRLMVPQLRGALQEVQDAGLGHLLKTYDGCYVPRFIERNPENSISLHTWGIAIDMDAATNYRGIRGTMDQRIADTFKRWGFRWGGDWKYTDPMHFELGALLDAPNK
jgi:hypothetical protein